MSNVTIKDSLAKIAISKNVIKEYKTSESERTVYLDNGTEFQIYLKNPYQTHLGIKIYVNDKSIGNMLVLKPGQSHWLDRFIDNDSRFLFSTYEVDDTPEMKYATARNGRVRVEFYHERENSPLLTTISNWNLNNNSILYNTSDCVLKGLSNDYISSYYNSTSSLNAKNNVIESSNVHTFEVDRSATKALNKQTMETGRVEKGSRSDQKFENCDINFDSYSFSTENIQILPNSRKQVRAEETRRKYCSQCGKKVGPKDKFCSNCGVKL